MPGSFKVSCDGAPGKKHPRSFIPLGPGEPGHCPVCGRAFLLEDERARLESMMDAAEKIGDTEEMERLADIMARLPPAERAQ